jgi:MFS family permease
MNRPPVARTTEDEGAGSLSRSQTAFLVAALVASVISFQLNATMLGPAIRDIDTELGPGAFAAMANYFYLSGAIANVVFIRWSDYIGRKRVLLGIMIVLCIGTVLCIVGSSLPVVLLGRILQGGCNVTFGLAFLILRERLSGQAFGFCCGVIASINGGVGGVDALVGGFMVDRFGYRSIFVLILVLGVAAIVFGAKAVPADDPGRAASGRMDWVGAALIALTVAGIDLFLAEGGHSGWSSPVALGFIAAAIVALVAFVVVEKRVAEPLIDIDEMRSRYAWPLIVVTILCLASFTNGDRLHYAVDCRGRRRLRGQRGDDGAVVPHSRRVGPTDFVAPDRTARGAGWLRDGVAGRTDRCRAHHRARRDLRAREERGHPADTRVGIRLCGRGRHRAERAGCHSGTAG